MQYLTIGGVTPIVWSMILSGLWPSANVKPMNPVAQFLKYSPTAKDCRLMTYPLLDNLAKSMRQLENGLSYKLTKPILGLSVVLHGGGDSNVLRNFWTICTMYS